MEAITLSSNLYYANLRVNNPKQVQKIVTIRIREFIDYLDRAIQRLKSQRYVFTYSVGSISVILKNNSEIQNHEKTHDFDPYEANLFLDMKGKRKIRVQDIKKEKKEINLQEGTEDGCIYARFKNRLIPFEYEIQKVILKNIQPVNIDEDEEEEVLDLLFESKEVFDTEENAKRNSKNGISTGKKIRKERTMHLERMPKSDRIWIGYNTYILKRQRQAVEELATYPRPHHIPLLNLFQKRDFLTYQWKIVEEVDLLHDYFVLTDSGKDGVEEQRRFVKIAMGTPDYVFLEGPPGSGKTTTLLELISQAVHSGKRVLMVASTHIAVDNILERLEDVRVQHENGKEKRLIDACGAIPLRIGDHWNVSEKIQKYCLDKCVDTELARLKHELEKLEARSPAQEKLYLQIVKANEDSKEIVENLLLESSNLICGTTIGVLQAPIIKKSGLTDPLFDFVILDEASKTTFQEFLVPALYGKRWILSGDVKQLSPYVDRTPIIENLKNIPSLQKKEGIDVKEICLSVFRAFNLSMRHKNKRLGSRGDQSILVTKNTEDLSDYSSFLEQQLRGIESLLFERGEERPHVSIKTVNSIPQNFKEKLEIFGSNLLIVPSSLIKEIEPYLPPDIGSEEYVSTKYQRIRAAYLDIKSQDLTKIRKREKRRWEDEVEWRIVRLHEKRDMKDACEELKLEIEMLLPYFDRMREGTFPLSKMVDGEINKIRRIALPSVLELLQQGFELSSEVRKRDNAVIDLDSIALYSGLNYGNTHPEILDSRKILLTYQHRMHSEISEFPRKIVYEGKALKDAGEITGKRNWAYTQYSCRSVWMDIRPKRNEFGTGSSKYNIAEINAMVRELKTFMEWARDHKNPGSYDNNWFVALLSFYTGQVKELSRALSDASLKNEFGLKGSFNDFSSEQCNTTIKICTVDRFQGHEADLVFLSFVRSRGTGIGFLDNKNRLNVAITRARYQLVLFGDRNHFKNSRAEVLEALANETHEGPIRYRE